MSSLVGSVKWAVQKNIWFLMLFIVAVFYCFGNVFIWYSAPVWFKRGVEVDGFFQNLSIGYIVSCMFYYMVVVVPEYKRYVVVNKKRNRYISIIYLNFIMMTNGCKFEKYLNLDGRLGELEDVYKEEVITVQLIKEYNEIKTFENIDKSLAVKCFLDLIKRCLITLNEYLDVNKEKIDTLRWELVSKIDDMDFCIKDTDFGSKYLDGDFYILYKKFTLFFDAAIEEGVWKKSDAEQVNRECGQFISCFRLRG